MTAPNIVSPTTITLKNVASTVPAGMAGGMFGVWLYLAERGNVGASKLCPAHVEFDAHGMCPKAKIFRPTSRPISKYECGFQESAREHGAYDLATSLGHAT